MSHSIRYADERDMNPSEVRALYDDAGWSAHTSNVDRLMQAIHGSHCVITARDGSHLTGLIRCISDGTTIVFVQDLLVLRSHRRLGIGSELVRRILGRYPEVRQKVLLTDEAPDVRAFYEKLGFQSCDHGGLVAFAMFEIR